MGLIQRLKEKRDKRREKWHIIDNMHDLPIGKYMEIQGIAKSEREEFDKSTAVLSVLTGWSEADIEQFTLEEYSALASGCGWLYEEIQPVEVRKEYRIGDYILRPTNATTATTAQLVAIQTYAKDIDGNMLDILALLLVPRGHKYGDGYDVEKVRNHIARYLGTDDAFSLIGFFLKQCEAYIPSLANSLERTIREAPARTIEQIRKKAEALAVVTHLSNNGGGLPTSNE